MGLDMYLEGEKYISSFPEGNRPMEDGFPVKGRTLELGYWRKHPNLHGYIVQEFADGVDECQEIALDQQQIEQIIEAVESDDLPETSGFFFGSSDGSEDEETIKIIKSALAWLTAEGMNDCRSVKYRASW